MIEADRLASDKDSYAVRNALPNNNRVIRGIELDDKGKPVAYWIYPEHPNSPYITRNQTPERIIAKDILHIYRKDRVGQSRGISWFAPVMAVNRDLGIYIENELQASAVSSCFSVAIKTETPIGSLSSPDGESNSDSAGNSFDYLEPAMVVRLRPGESVESIDPGRPNSGSEPWINLMLRGMAAGTGTSFEAISKNFSQTSYSSSRTSKLEDRPRYKRWQNLVIDDLCQPVWDEFCNAAALAGLDGFPSSMELLDGRRRVAPVDWQTPEWEWVDPTSEQNAASDAINKYMSTYQDELGSRGRSWRATYYQAAKERKLRLKLGLLTPEEKTAQMMAAQTQNSQPTASAEAAPNVASQALNGAQVTSLVNVITQVGTGAMPKETAIPVLKASFPSLSEELITAIIAPITPGSVSADGVPVAAPDASTEQASGSSGEWMGLSRLQFNRNRKALTDILNGLKDGSMSSVLAETQLAMIGVSQDNIQKIIADAGDGKIDSPIPAEV
jgi:lambda family phage portal protein